jgi:hypothetical protein
MDSPDGTEWLQRLHLFGFFVMCKTRAFDSRWSKLKLAIEKRTPCKGFSRTSIAKDDRASGVTPTGKTTGTRHFAQ